MGFNIGGLVGGLVKSVAPAIFKAVAPAVSKTLEKVADSFLGKAGNFAKGLVSNLPSPISKFLSGLIDKGVAAGQDLTTPKGIQDLLAKLTGMPREVAGAPAGTPPVTVPGIGTAARAQGQAAATAATAAGIAQAQNTAATNSVARPGGGDVADQAIRAIGALTEPAIPGPDASPQELAQYEKDTKRYDRMMELMSSIIKKRDELQMSIIRKM